MNASLVYEFALFQDDQILAVCRTIDEAQAKAAPYIASASASDKFKIITTSSVVVPGIGASSMQTWNYNRDLSRWVEFIR